MLAISRIRIDGGTQSRAEINQDIVKEYAELNGVLPQPVVYYDGSSYWLAAGFHRLFGAKLAGKNEIDCDIRQGSLDDAMIDSAKSNIAHGMRRTNADKRASVLMLLRNPHFEDKSDVWLAEICGVTDKLVADVRKSYGSETQEDKGDNSTSEESRSKNDQTRSSRDGRRRPATTKKLCERCQRVGKVKNCGMCRELNASGGGRKRKPKDDGASKDDVPKDAFGVELPKHCRAAYGDPWMQSAIDFLAEFGEKFRQERLADGLRKRAKHYPFINDKDFRDGVGFVSQYLDQLVDALKEGRPAGVCPACGGERCAKCKHTGLVPREIYKDLHAKAKA